MHRNVSSIKPFGQVDKQFHEEMRKSENKKSIDFSLSTSASSNIFTDQQQTSTDSVMNFNDCVFNCENFNS